MTGDDEITTDMPDLTDYTPAEIDALIAGGDSVIAKALARLAADMDNPVDAVAGLRPAI